MVVEKVQFRHFSWLHKVERLLRILILHDAFTDTESVISVLEQGGFTPVLQCIDSLEALQGELERQEWDVVIADYGTSPMQAFKALRMVKSLEFDLPFILVADTSNEAFVTRILHEGADGFLQTEQLGRLVPMMDHALRKLEHRRGFVEKALQTEEACRTKEVLVTGLLHEMQSTMSVEQQLLDFMVQGRFGNMEEGQMALLEEIIQSKRQTAQLVENIFWVFTEANDGRSRHLERIDLNGMLEHELLPMFSRDIKLKQLALRVTLHADLPQVDVDALGLGLVFRNLMHQAVQLADAGGTVTVKTQVQDSFVICSVHNSGIALEENYLETLFEQGETASGRFRTPVALGLYLSQKILDACHGELGFEPQPQGGSLFFVKLPVP